MIRDRAMLTIKLATIVFMMFFVIWPLGPASNAMRPMPHILEDVGPLTVLHYVSQAGDDANDGSASHPWATIQHADTVVVPGDTVIVLDGLYIGDIVLRSSGNPGHPITYMAEHKWKARLVGSGKGDGSAVIGVNGGHVILKDFDITGTDANGIILAYAGSIASYNAALGNYVHDMITPCDSNSGTGIETGGGDNYGSVTHNDIIGNVVANITPYNGCPGGHQASGIFAEIPDSVIASNLVINAGYGIQSWHAASRLTIYGNTLVNNLRSITVGAGDSPGGVTNDYSLVQNNVIYNSTETAIAETGTTGPHNQYVNNLIYRGNTQISLDHGLRATGTINSDPQFVNNTGTAFGDYHLRPGSPARGAGLALAGITTDFQGIDRPQAGPTDLGAFLSPGSGAARTRTRVASSDTRTSSPTSGHAASGVVAAAASANPVSIRGGQSSVISWTTRNAVRATLNGAPVLLKGSRTVSPTVTTIYKVIATGSTGKSDWGSATVTVNR